MSVYLKYHLRWQFSTIVMLFLMFPLEHWFNLPVYLNLPIGQFFGAIIFWKIDKWILQNNILKQGELWQIKNNIVCSDCDKSVTKGYRLVSKDFKYDKLNDISPEFRCKLCSKSKYKKIMNISTKI